MSTGLLYSNGIFVDDGSYLIPPLTVEQAARIAREGPPPDVRSIEDLQIWVDTVTRARAIRGDGNTFNLAEAGWGVIFAASEEPSKVADIKKALAELFQLRESEAEGHFKICEGDMGYQQGDDDLTFLRRHGAPINDEADPEKLPYYLLIVGDPERIPYEFQHQLDVQYAVGRIWFDHLKDFRQYAASVVAAEGSVLSQRRAAFFAPLHQNDPESSLSLDQLAGPLARWAKVKCTGWDIETYFDDKATKDCLGRLLGGDSTPAFLFTAGHGACYRPSDDYQPYGQGALMCKEWPGPGHRVEVAHRFDSWDLRPDGHVGGLITFHFACDSAGTYKVSKSIFRTPVQVAKRAFIAKLPQDLLAHPNGGALAVIGHVGGAWRRSVEWPDYGTQIQAFEDVVQLILKGRRVGEAMEKFGIRYAKQATGFTDLFLRERDWGMLEKDSDIAFYWTATHDTRNYVVLGDPAVRLPIPPPSR